MSDVRIFVQFENGEPGFQPGKPYEVLVVQDRKFLLVSEDARLLWVEPERVTPASVWRGGERLFDLDIHRRRLKLEGLAGKKVVLTTWEHLGFDPDEVTSEDMFLYRGTVESYDGETLFLRHEDAAGGRFGVLPKAIATIEEIE